MSVAFERRLFAVAIPLIVSAPMARSFGEEMVVDGVRPIADAIEKLEDQFHVPITYEDPLYQHSEDLEDQTAIVARSKPLDGKVIMGMKGRRLKFMYPAPISSRTPESQAELAVQSMVEANNRDYAPGNFEFRRAGGRLHVYPKQVKNQSGQYVAHASLLDWPISIEPKDRTIMEFLDLLCQAVSKASGTLVQANVRWSQQRTTLGGQNKTARDLLLDLLIELEGRDAEGGHKYTWALLTYPSIHQFVLNLRTLSFSSAAAKVSPVVNLPSLKKNSTIMVTSPGDADAGYMKPAGW